MINPAVTYLILFYAASMIIFTMYGGGFATIPAYLADIFGTKYVGGIHGRLLTAWSTAGVLGPLAITQLRQKSVEESINELAQKVSPEKFEEFFGEFQKLESLKTIEKHYQLTQNLSNCQRKPSNQHKTKTNKKQCFYKKYGLYMKCR